MEEEDNNELSLSAHTLLALQEFLSEHMHHPHLLHNASQEEGGGGGRGLGLGLGLEMVSEDWGMSQFWYDASTARTLAHEVLHLTLTFGSKVACVSCPSLYVQLREMNRAEISLNLFEFDRRFARYGRDFVYYDYNYPQDLDTGLFHFFDIVVADPPYLSKECIEKISQSLSFLSKDSENAPLLLLTGAVQEIHAQRLLNLHPCVFRPTHHNKLGNEFKLYTNYDPHERLGGWEASTGSQEDVLG